MPFRSPQSCISGSIFNADSGQCRFILLWGTGSPQGTAWPTHCVAENLGDEVLHALLIEEPGSQGNLEAVLFSSLLTQAVAEPGIQVCTGWVRAMAVPAQM